MKKQTKKWKIVLLIVLVVAVVGASVTIPLYRAQKNRLEVNLASLTTGNVVKKYSTSAPVKAASNSVFYALNGVKILEVNVKVGDVVEPGTVLATFDTASLSEAQEEKQRAADNAKTAYDDALKAAESAREALPSIESEIEKLESQADSGSSSSSSSSSSFDISSVVSLFTSLLNGGSLDMSSLMGTALASESQLAQLQIQKIVLETQMSDSYLNGLKQKRDTEQTSLSVFLSQLALLKNGWTAESRGIVSKVNIQPGQTFVVESSGGSSSSLDISSLMGMLSGGTADVSSLVSMLSGMAGTSSDSSSSATIGMVIENYNEFLASFSLGKYDMTAVRVGQRAVVKSVNEEYEAEVTYISATANSSSDINITSILGGVSSSSSAAEGIVTIKSPDEGIVIGFDVDIDIITDEAFNVLTLPVESIRWTAEGNPTVYVYNEKSKKIEYREIQTGISDSSTIQVLSGLSEGDKVVRNVLSGSSKLLADGLKVKVNTADTGSAGAA